MTVNLDAEIDAARERLAELNRLREVTAGRLAKLTRLRAARRHPANSGEDLSQASKLEIFRGLFGSRDDVFAVRWESQGKSRSGYSPRCANEWKPGICGKPKVRCGACTNQAFVPLDDRELLGHLRGQQVVGVYPLLPGNLCRFLAIDLDGGAWKSDVLAIAKACESLNIEPAVERSRSGDGAHVWFFFSDAVSATDARSLGFTILTRAMSDSPTLGVDSYDRLFPSQDVLPNGGFGNLIALPLQRQARQTGCTEFLDDRLEPHPDQWSYLASIPRITPKRLRDLTADDDDDAALAVRPAGESRQAPWRPAPTLRQRLRQVKLPASLEATLADRLYVDQSGLPPALINALRRLATFANPMFAELQRMRLSVARTPRVVRCFDDVDGYLALPRGCATEVGALLEELGVQFELRDERAEGGAVDFAFQGELTSSQSDAARAMLAHDLGVLAAPPGWGKTVPAAHLIAARGRSTLVLVHRNPLVEQWVQRLAEFLGLPENSIGRIGGGRRRATGRLDIAMLQTLTRKDDIGALVHVYGHVVIDECHHIPAVSLERVLASTPARFITGLTATPYRRDGHQPIITMQCGPVHHTAKAGAGSDERRLERRLIRRDTRFDPSVLPTDPSIQEIYTALAAATDRLQQVAADVRDLLHERRAIMLLTERRDHLDRLAAALDSDAPDLIALHGGIKPKARRAALAHLASLPADQPSLVLATGRYLGEGFDDPRLDTLLLTMPIAWKGTVVQYAGRLHRSHPAKHDVRIYDYVDAEVPVLRRMYAKRLRVYNDMGYTADGQLACIA